MYLEALDLAAEPHFPVFAKNRPVASRCDALRGAIPVDEYPRLLRYIHCLFYIFGYG
jgi:hypothetical protein